MKRLLNLIAACMGLMALPPASRKDAELAAKFAELGELLKGDFTSEETAAVTKALADLTKAHDETVTKLRELERRSLDSPTVYVDERFGPAQQVRFRFSSNEKAREFYALAKKVYDKALTPGDDPAGGYTIPDSMSQEIWQMVEKVGVLDMLCPSMPLGPGQTTLPMGLSGVLSYFKGFGAAGTATEPTFAQATMVAKTLFSYAVVDFEMEEDSAVAIGNYLATAFAYAIALKRDTVGLTGSGLPSEGQITGILNSDRVTVVDMLATKTTFQLLASGDLFRAEAGVAEMALNNASWLMSRSVKAIAYDLKLSAGNFAFRANLQGRSPGELIGYPLYTSGGCPAASATAASTKFIIFGDFAQGLAIGTRGAIRIDRSEIPGFTTGQVYWRAISRFDMVVRGYTAAQIAANTQLANPLSVLKTAGS